MKQSSIFSPNDQTLNNKYTGELELVLYLPNSKWLPKEEEISLGILREDKVKKNKFNLNVYNPS